MFIFSVMGIFVVDSLFLALPTSYPLLKFFEIEQFTNDLNYKFHLLAGIVLCSILTFATEKFIAINYTRVCDRDVKYRKDLAFS